jgi:hypothetical protein
MTCPIRYADKVAIKTKTGTNLFIFISGLVYMTMRHNPIGARNTPC